MWEDLQERAKGTNGSAKLVGELSYNVVRESTSDSMGSDSEGAVFDKTIESFEKLRGMAELSITQAIKSAQPVSFKNYITKPQWCTIGDGSSGKDTDVFVHDNCLQFNRFTSYFPYSRTWWAS